MATWDQSQSGVLNPTEFFANCQIIGTGNNPSTGTGIYIPYSDLESYGTNNAANGVASTGDIRELVYSILSEVEAGINSLSANAKPSQFKITKAYNSTSETTARKVFTVTFDLNVGAATFDVAEE